MADLAAQLLTYHQIYHQNFKTPGPLQIQFAITIMVKLRIEHMLNFELQAR